MTDVAREPSTKSALVTLDDLRAAQRALKGVAVRTPLLPVDALREAIREAKGSTKPIRVIVQADSFVSTMQIDYHDGERFPALERVNGTPAYLDDIIKPLTTPEKAPEQKKEDAE